MAGLPSWALMLKDRTWRQLTGSTTAESIYGAENLASIVKMVTVAPEVSNATDLITELARLQRIRISLGHSAATYDEGIAGLQAGATALTHVFNAMNSLHHRSPGLVGLIASPLAPFYSVIPDGIHVHPAALAMVQRANP